MASLVSTLQLLTPSQNGVAERLNRTLAEGVIAMLNQAGLPESFWGAAVNYLVHILNATPSSSTSKTTSFEVWKRRKPDLTLYRTFGCRAWVHVMKKDRTAFGSHTRKCIFIGFCDGYKGWKVYEPSTRKIFVSRDVLFDEKSFPGTSVKGSEDALVPLGIHTFWPEDNLDADIDAAAPDNPNPPAPPAPGPPAPGPLAQAPPPITPHQPPPNDDWLTPDWDADAYSPSWEDGKNRTGRALTQLTPPRYATNPPLPDPSHPRRVGERLHSPKSPLRSQAPRYLDVIPSPPQPHRPLPELWPLPQPLQPVRCAQAEPLVAQGSRPIQAG